MGLPPRKKTEDPDGRYFQTSRHTLKKRRPSTPTQEFACAEPTRIDPSTLLQQTTEAPMGDTWFIRLQFEMLATFARNLYNAGGLELVKRITLADAEIARTRTREFCHHHSVARFADVGVCTACLIAVDRIV